MNPPRHTIGSILKVSEEWLAARGIDQPKVDAGFLLAHALDVDRLQLYLQTDRPLVEAELAAFRPLLQRRGRREPVSRIVGTKGFWKHDFKVTPAVLCPRADSETLIELAVKAPVPEQAKVLDLCTGSGCLAISLAGEKPQWHIDATDSCPHALEVAQENMATCGVQDRVCLHLGDLWAHCTGPYQLIVSNPPYIGETERAELDPEVLDYDPALALFSGTDGLDLMRRLVGEAAQHLAPEGILMVEHGHQQSEAVQALFTQAGFTGVDSHRDLGGRLRVTQGTRRS